VNLSNWPAKPVVGTLCKPTLEIEHDISELGDELRWMAVEWCLTIEVDP